MVVVFVTHNYPRYHGDLPGSFLQPLALALSDRGHDVRVVAPADRGNDGRAPLDGIPVRRVRYATPERETLAYEGRMLQAVRTPGGVLALRRLVWALRAGAQAEASSAQGEVVLHAHWWIPAGLALPPHPPALVTLHGTDGRILTRSSVARWLGRRVLRRARVVTAVSPELAAIAERVSGRRDVASHVQPMPLRLEDPPVSWGGGGGGMLVIARLTEQKRTALALGAVAELARGGNLIPLTIIGDGVERAGLERLAASLPNSPSITFTGQLPHPEVSRRLATADVLVFPARQEGLGLAALEALIAGVPVVACLDGGGVVSALERYGGGIVTEASATALATAVLEARAPQLRAQAREAGERWRSELAPERVAGVFEEWYREVLRG